MSVLELLAIQPRHPIGKQYVMLLMAFVSIASYELLDVAGLAKCNAASFCSFNIVP
eukprot:Ihof_evm2s975 gene=Ihof_evmTU2s975